MQCKPNTPYPTTMQTPALLLPTNTMNWYCDSDNHETHFPKYVVPGTLVLSIDPGA